MAFIFHDAAALNIKFSCIWIILVALELDWLHLNKIDCCRTANPLPGPSGHLDWFMDRSDLEIKSQIFDKTHFFCQINLIREQFLCGLAKIQSWFRHNMPHAGVGRENLSWVQEIWDWVGNWDFRIGSMQNIAKWSPTFSPPPWLQRVERGLVPLVPPVPFSVPKFSSVVPNWQTVLSPSLPCSPPLTLSCRHPRRDSWLCRNPSI